MSFSKERDRQRAGKKAAVVLCEDQRSGIGLLIGLCSSYGDSSPSHPARPVTPWTFRRGLDAENLFPPPLNQLQLIRRIA